MKKFLKIVAILIVLFVIFIIGVNYYITNYFDRDIIVKQVEANLNTRFDLKNIKIGLFSFTPSLVMDEIKFAKRDKYADDKIHIDERPELNSEMISVKKIEFEANLIPLLSKKIVLNKFLVSEPVFKMTIKDDGRNNVTQMFDHPSAGKTVPVKTIEEPTKPVEDVKETTPEPVKESAEVTKKEIPESKPFTNEDLPFATDLNQIGIEDARIDIFIEKTQQKMQIDDLDMIISSIDIDPKNLKEHNKAVLQFDADLSITDKNNSEQAKFILASKGDIAPFDLKTGQINPEIIYTITIGKTSFISGLVALEKLKSTMTTLTKLGLDLKILSEKAELSKDAVTKIKYKDGKVSFLEDLVLETKSYDLTLSKNSWFNVMNNLHNFKGELLVSKVESEKLLKDVDKFIDEQLAKVKTKDLKFDKEKIKSELLSSVVKDGRIYLVFESEGNISDPKVKVSANIPSLTKLIENTVKDAVKDKVKAEVKKIEKKVKKEVDKVVEENKDKAEEEAKDILKKNKIKVPKF